MRLYLFILSFLFCCCANIATAQDSLAVNNSGDSTIIEESGIQIKTDSVLTSDTVRIKKGKFQPDAKRAGLYSALIPGFGQLYNRQYWKMPIIYAAMGTTMYFVIKGNSDYRRYRKAYVSRLSNGANSNDEFQGILSDQAIKQYQDGARQNMDMMIVLTVVGYAGQILEAISGAHLRNFDISPDLTMQIRPVITPINTFGIGLVMNFKK